MTTKEQILKMIEEEIAKYDKMASQASELNDYVSESQSMDRALVLGKLRKRIKEEVK